MDELFNDHVRLNRLTSGLPLAFEMATREVPKGNPAIGIVREHIIIGFLTNEFGNKNVTIPSDGNTRAYDVIVRGNPVSIKTIKGNSDVKVLWTVDPLQIGKEISNRYKPNCDIFLVSIYWGKCCESIYYIKKEAQQQIHSEMGENYLNAKVGTNHRGISISRKAMKKLKSDSSTLKSKVDWVKSGLLYKPYDRWEDFWRKRTSA